MDGCPVYAIRRMERANPVAKKKGELMEGLKNCIGFPGKKH
jgi:hypothetical protein